MVSGRYLGQGDSIRVNGQIRLKPLLIRYLNIKGIISKHHDTKKRGCATSDLAGSALLSSFPRIADIGCSSAITYGALYIYTFFSQDISVSFL